MGVKKSSFRHIASKVEKDIDVDVEEEDGINKNNKFKNFVNKVIVQNRSDVIKEESIDVVNLLSMWEKGSVMNKSKRNSLINDDDKIDDDFLSSSGDDDNVNDYNDTLEEDKKQF